MKTIEVRHGCYTAEVCGALASHTCGSPDACNKVKANGVVCTFGTLVRTMFHEPAELAAEAASAEVQHEMLFGKPSAAERAAIRVAVAKGKNIHSAEAEQAARDGGKAHGVSNRAFHDANPAVFGHD